MQPHLSIHGGRDQNGRARGERDRGERVMRQTVRELGDNVRRRRCDEEEIRSIGQLDVTGPPIFLFIKKTGHDRIFRERLQSERGNELGRVLRHHDENLMALFDEQTGELGRFVSGDRAADTEQDCFRARTQAHDLARTRFLNAELGILSHLRSIVTFG